MKADATEMKGAAVAQACWQQRVPFLVICSLSDDAGNIAYGDAKNFYGITARNSASFVIAILELIAKTIACSQVSNKFRLPSFLHGSSYEIHNFV